MKYKLIIDYGKPYEEEANTEEELKTELTKLNEISKKEEYAYFDVVVLNEKGEDITESQFIQEMISKIMGEVA